MHERYIYLGDILSVIYVMITGIKKIHIPILINISSTLCYYSYLYKVNLLDIKYITILNFIALILITIDLIKDIKREEIKRIDTRSTFTI